MGAWKDHCHTGCLLLGTLLVAGLAWWPASAAGATTGAGLRVAVLASQEEAPYLEVADSFRQRLEQNRASLLLKSFPLPEQTAQRATELKELRAFHPNLVLALGSPALQAVNGSIRDVPVVFAMVLNTAGLSRAGNVTGVTLEFPILTQLEWLKKILPRVRTLGVVFNPQENGHRIAEARRAAGKLGLTHCCLIN